MSAQTDIVSSLSNPAQFGIGQRKKRQITEGSKILSFVMCVIAIYSCLIVNGIIQERIYKVPYAKINSTQMNFYTDSISPMILTSFFAVLIGFARLQEQDISLQIPIKKLLVVAGLEIIIHILLMISIIQASFSVVVMANSSALLSVIIVGVYFSKQKRRIEQSYDPKNDILEGANQQNQNRENPQNSNQNQKLGVQKIWICLIVIVGVYLFNMYSPKVQTENDKSSHPLTIITVAILLLAIFLQGVKPQLQIRLKNQYQPSPICFYYNMNKVICMLTLVCSIVSTQFFYTIQFIATHDQLLFHLVIMSLLNSICIMFIYKIITIFRQHVYPLVSTVRKCLTVAVNLLYFHHSVSPMQILGIVLVFGGVLLQIVLNYKLCKKYDIEIPFTNQQKKQRYVKNQMALSESNRKYKVYKVIQKDQDIVGI